MSEPSPARVKQLFHEAVERPPEKRAAFLDGACGADAPLRRRVERLLRSLDEVGPFLDAPTVEILAQASSPGRTRTGAALQPGSMLGTRYRIVELAGRGGMGEVYRADDLELQQTVALKLLPAEVGRDASRLARLRDEVRIARQVSHPNVCRVYDIGEADGRQFLSMEWIDGRDLSAVLREGGRLPRDRATFIARQLCRGLAAAHDCRVVHRDLKPSNVMLDDRGVARITDFGLAEIAAVVPGEKAREGTPQYMSPEQLAGEEVGPPSDIYSLGLLLYELFTGRHGYPGRTLEELTEQRRSLPPRPSSLAGDIDPEIERAILCCLEVDPSRRPPGARALVEALPGNDRAGDPLVAAQQRADRIAAFRAEVAELRQAGMLRIRAEELQAVDAHHERVLRDLVQRFDVDVSERGKQLSLGMRAVSFVGAFALAASVYYLFYRIWGGLGTPLQVGVLAGAPIAALLLSAVVARRERSGYFTLMSALAALAGLIVNTSLLGETFNLAPSPLTVLAWGVFAMILAYAFRLRLLLVAGFAALAAFVAATALDWSGGWWTAFPLRPEGFFAGGVALLALTPAIRHPRSSGFAPVFRVAGLVLLVAPTLFLGMVGPLSYLALDPRKIEIAYQVLGFALAAAAIWAGIALRFREVIYTGTFFFVALLFLEFVNWWWDWMPKYLFFLIVALTSMAVVFALKRLRRTVVGIRSEAGS